MTQQSISLLKSLLLSTSTLIKRFDFSFSFSFHLESDGLFFFFETIFFVDLCSCDLCNWYSNDFESLWCCPWNSPKRHHDWRIQSVIFSAHPTPLLPNRFSWIEGFLDKGLSVFPTLPDNVIKYFETTISRLAFWILFFFSFFFFFFFLIFEFSKIFGKNEKKT